jgi:uracil-DNA glycosylase family 4
MDENTWNSCAAATLGYAFSISTDAAFFDAYKALMDELDERAENGASAACRAIGRDRGHVLLRDGDRFDPREDLELSDPRQELRDLAAGFRTHLEARGRCGLVGVSRRPSPASRPARYPRWRRPSAMPSRSCPSRRRRRSSTTRARSCTAGVGSMPCGRDRRLPALQAGQGAPHIVFGVGNPEANLMFVGEAPGADEDAQGEPFVGAAGQLLTKMIKAMGYERSEVYICNIIKCRPPQNRNPEPDEIEACEQFLRKQIAIVQPRVIVALGKFAAHFLCGDNTPITRLRGNLRTYHEIPVMPTYHPAFCCAMRAARARPGPTSSRSWAC